MRPAEMSPLFALVSLLSPLGIMALLCLGLVWLFFFLQSSLAYWI